MSLYIRDQKIHIKSLSSLEGGIYTLLEIYNSVIARIKYIDMNICIFSIFPKEKSIEKI